MHWICPLCGGELRETVTGCSTCPMNSGCDMVCCDNCGYETVAPRSRIVDFVKGIFQKLKANDTPRVS